jgi:hypothetical protein
VGPICADRQWLLGYTMEGHALLFLQCGYQGLESARPIDTGAHYPGFCGAW